MFLLRQGFHRLVKLAAQVCPASHNPDIIRQAVVARISVCMQPTEKAIQKVRCIAGFTIRAEFVEHHRMPGAAARPVKPHIALGLGCLPGFLQHLERGFIRILDFLLYKPVVHLHESTLHKLKE